MSQDSMNSTAILSKYDGVHKHLGTQNLPEKLRAGRAFLRKSDKNQDTTIRRIYKPDSTQYIHNSTTKLNNWDAIL